MIKSVSKSGKCTPYHYYEINIKSQHFAKKEYTDFQTLL